MAHRYETGTKNHVIYEAIRCAIQDRTHLIYCHQSVESGLTKEDKETRAECESVIRDFEKLGKSLLGQEVEFLCN